MKSKKRINGDDRLSIKDSSTIPCCDIAKPRRPGLGCPLCLSGSHTSGVLQLRSKWLRELEQASHRIENKIPFHCQQAVGWSSPRHKSATYDRTQIYRNSTIMWATTRTISHFRLDSRQTDSHIHAIISLIVLFVALAFVGTFQISVTSVEDVRPLIYCAMTDSTQCTWDARISCTIRTEQNDWYASERARMTLLQFSGSLGKSSSVHYNLRTCCNLPLATFHSSLTTRLCSVNLSIAGETSVICLNLIDLVSSNFIRHARTRCCLCKSVYSHASASKPEPLPPGQSFVVILPVCLLGVNIRHVTRGNEEVLLARSYHSVSHTNLPSVISFDLWGYNRLVTQYTIVVTVPPFRVVHLKLLHPKVESTKIR